MLRSHNLAFCGWVNIKIYKLLVDMYIENYIRIKYKIYNIKYKNKINIAK